ncbi:Tetraspanin family protein [Entamoeba marina]
MPSLKRAFSTTSIFLFTLGIIGIILPSTVFIYARNSMHFIPMGVKLILSLGICGGIIAVITSMIGIYGGFSIQKILLYIYIGGVALTALLFFSATVVSFIGTVSTDGSLYFFWKNLSSDQKAFTEVAFRCCGWKSYASTGCAYYPIVGETQVACYSKLYFPYLAFIFVSLIFGSLATVMCITFIGIVVYFLFNFGPAKIKETYSAEEEEATDDYGDDSTNDL